MRYRIFVEYKFDGKGGKMRRKFYWIQKRLFGFWHFAMLMDSEKEAIRFIENNK